MEFTIIANSQEIPFQEDLNIRGKIIALDGIADSLLKSQYLPFAVVGDFDSISPETIQAYKKLGVIIFQVDDQNTTDLDKGIEFCKSKGATGITIINSFGGARVDHTIMSYRSLRRHHSNSCRIRIKEQNSYIEFIRDSKIIIEGCRGDKIALFSAPLAYITSKGLTYDMDNYKLYFGCSESVSNSLACNNATMQIKGEVIIIYQVNSKLQKWNTCEVK